MKYVRKGEVVKPVSDELEGNYAAAGWKPVTKQEYESTIAKTNPPRPTTPRSES